MDYVRAWMYTFDHVCIRETEINLDLCTQFLLFKSLKMYAV